MSTLLNFLDSNEDRFDTRVGPNMVIEGRITFTGDLRVDGTIKGAVGLWQSCTGTLVVGKDGYVEGDVNTTNAVVSGKLKGTVQASDIVALGKTADISGDIKYGRMVARGQAAVHGHVAPLGDVVEPPRLKREENTYEAEVSAA